LNLYSSYIDGSVIYGNSEAKANSLRTFNGGFLKTTNGITASKVGVTNRTFLPLSSNICSSSNTTHCFTAGEHRTSENLGLVSVQTLFNREHNRIAAKLAENNPLWSDEYIYQETRRIVIAILQHIVYNEWLPSVTGNSTLSPLSTSEYYNGYDSSVNPGKFKNSYFKLL
jgi:peroxidase